MRYLLLEGVILAVGVIALLLCDSLTIVFAAIIITFLIFFKHRETLFKFNKTQFLCACFAFSFFVIALAIVSSIGDKFLAYFFRGEIYSAGSAYMPSLVGCDLLKVLTGFGPGMSYGLNERCHPGEFHFFYFFLNYGFLPTFGWHVALAFPAIVFMKSVRKMFKDPLFFLYLAFILPMSHYSGVEIWGNNYLFAIVFVLILKKYHNQESL